MSFLPAPLYEQIEQSLPIACVDFVSFRVGAGGNAAEVGLIKRRSPFGTVWCHLGGRIIRGESVAQALRRHARDTLDVDLDLPPDPQPRYVYQWFPPDDTPDKAEPHGIDPRKHAIGLSFVVDMVGDPKPRNEALSFDFFAVDALPAPLWPGTEYLVRRLLADDHVS